MSKIKIKRSTLIKIISESLALNEQHGPQGVVDNIKSILGKAYYAYNPSSFYTVKGGVEDTNEWKKSPKSMLDFMDLFSTLHFTYHAEDSETGSSTTDNRENIVVTSVYREGHEQAHAIKSKIDAGETREDIVKLYSNPKDPFMSNATGRTAGDAYDFIASGDLESAEELLNRYPISAHLEGVAIDLRADTPFRKQSIGQTLENMKNAGYVNIFYQYEATPPHYHISPAKAGADKFLTQSGKSLLSNLRSESAAGSTEVQEPDEPGIFKTAFDYYKGKAGI